MTDWYDAEQGNAEHILALPNTRQLAYAHSGPVAARTVVLFFSGLMSVGTARDVPQPCRDVNAHWIAPTIPGAGNSSPRSPGEAYHVALAKDITALLSHLHPDGLDTLYIAGGSYGTVQAQMLYGASYDLFPAGRKIAGCMLLAGFSPFRHHKTYAKTLTWQNWFSVGPPAQLIPFHLLQRLAATVIASKLRTVAGAQDFLRQMLFSHMDEAERRNLEAYLRKKNRSEEEFLESMARGAIKACLIWDGFYEVSDVLHSDWGFAPAALDEEHASKPVLIVGSEGDHLGGSTNGWTAANYKSSTLKIIPGGHISALYYMDDLWSELLECK
jgi:pimeloyl-ACP methyl ester carboxylesterase